MSFRTNAVKVQAFAGALFGLRVGSTTMAQVNADITSNGGLANTLNSYYASSFGSVANATVAASVATNLGLTGDALASGVAYITAQLNASAANARGSVISTILDQFAGLASDATFGAAATAYNAKVAAAVAYTGADNAAIGTVIANNVFTLTTGPDALTGAAGNDTFNASPATVSVFGITGVFDSFSGDVLDGGNGDDTLNIVASGEQGLTGFSSVNIENINISTRAAPGSDGGNVEIDFQDVTGVKVLTAQSLRQSLELHEVREISELVYKGNLRGDKSNVKVNYATETVSGNDDTLELTVDGSTNGGLVTVNGIETVSISSVGTEENYFDLSAVGATVNISGDGDLNLAAIDATEVNNAATSKVNLYAELATVVSNTGKDLTVHSVKDDAIVTNSGDGVLVYDVNGSGQNVTINNTGFLTVKSTNVGSTINNSGNGKTTIEGSAATKINSTGGALTVKGNAYAVDAVITASGSSNLTVDVKRGATIDASKTTGTVVLNVNDNDRTTLKFTGSTGDDKVVLGAVSGGALIAGDVLDGGDGKDTIELSADYATLDFVSTSGVTNFETVTYSGNAAVKWTNLDKLSASTDLVFAAINVDIAPHDAAPDGVASITLVEPGGNGLDGVIAVPNVSILDLGGVGADISVVLTQNLSAIGGQGGDAGDGGVGYTDKAAAQAGSAGGTGGDGSVGGMGASVLSTTAETLTLTLNGVTLNSSGGKGGAGGNGANGGKGGNSSTTNGADGGHGGSGGNGGKGGAAAVTVAALSAKTVFIHSNVSETSTRNELIASGGQGGKLGLFGIGGTGGATTASGAIAGLNGNNGTIGEQGKSGASAAGLSVADEAKITIDGSGDLTLGLINGDKVTIDASELTGDLTFATNEGDDTIVGGSGVNTITLNGGADTVDLSASLDVQDTVYIKFANGTDAAEQKIVEITGFTLGNKTSGDTLSVSVGKALSIVGNINETNGSVSTSSTPATAEVTTISFVEMQPGEFITVSDKTFTAPEVESKESALFRFNGSVHNLVLTAGDTLTIMVGNTQYDYTGPAKQASYEFWLGSAVAGDPGWEQGGDQPTYVTTGIMGQLEALEPGNLTDLSTSSIKFGKNGATPIPYFNGLEVTDGSMPGASPAEVKEYFMNNKPTGWEVTDNNFFNSLVFTSSPTKGNVQDLVVTGTGFAPAILTVQGVDPVSSSDILFSVRDGIALVTRPVDIEFGNILDTVFVDILGNNTTPGDIVAFEFGNDTYVAVDADGNKEYNTETDYVIKLVGIDASSISISNGGLYVNGTHIAIA